MDVCIKDTNNICFGKCNEVLRDKNVLYHTSEQQHLGKRSTFLFPHLQFLSGSDAWISFSVSFWKFGQTKGGRGM
jgi:hypothetical protein